MIEDVDANKVWAAMAADPRAQLCDVRTAAEWNFVGLADLHELAREPLLLSWQAYPNMQRNPDFVKQLQAVVPSLETPIYFLCRSGARSLAAAEAAAAAGFTHVYNIADGFEGPLDPEGQRGRIAGWKATGLPWRQH